jgi:putative chitinase
MDLAAAIRAAASDAPPAAIDALERVRGDVAAVGALDSPLRAAHLIGQCAHESSRFTRVAESLFYTTTSRICAVWPGRFPSEASAGAFVRNPEALANQVYGGRMGNDAPGDGFRYRGRGYIQLTGKDNYRVFGDRLGVDLVARPERAEEPETAWLIAASYLANRRRSGRTALEWADLNDVETVTRIINGATHGLEDRRDRTTRALAALGGVERRPTLRRGSQGDAVRLLQHELAARGFALGAIDGDFGNRTEAAVRAFQQAHGLEADGVVRSESWDALEAVPA